MEGGGVSLRDAMPGTAAFIDALRAEFGAETIDRAIRGGLAGLPTFYAEEGGHSVGCVETIERSANTHTFSEAEFDDMTAERARNKETTR